MNTVLLLDHSYKLSCKIADTLFRNSVNVFRMGSEEQCGVEAMRLRPAGIIVALSKENRDQRELMARLVRNRNVPVIVVSENHDEAEELEALEMGVAAFLDGGASCELIAARILRALSIGAERGNSYQVTDDHNILKHEDLELDLDAYSAKWRDQDLEVTCKEMWLLVALIRRPGVVKSRSSLIDEAYAENIHVDERTIDSHMKRIRSKFREIDPDFDGIESVYGVGYRFRVQHGNTAGIIRSENKRVYPKRTFQNASRIPVLHGLRVDAGCIAS